VAWVDGGRGPSQPTILPNGHFAEVWLRKSRRSSGSAATKNDAEILGYARQVQAQIELLTGHRLEGEQMRLNIEPNGLPFVPTLDAQAATLHGISRDLAIAIQVHPEFANASRSDRVQDVLPRAVPKAEAQQLLQRCWPMPHQRSACASPTRLVCPGLQGWARR